MREKVWEKICPKCEAVVVPQRHWLCGYKCPQCGSILDTTAWTWETTPASASSGSDGKPPVVLPSTPAKRPLMNYFLWGGATVGGLLGMISLTGLASGGAADSALAGGFIAGKGAAGGALIGGIIGGIVDSVRKAG